MVLDRISTIVAHLFGWVSSLIPKQQVDKSPHIRWMQKKGNCLWKHFIGEPITSSAYVDEIVGLVSQNENQHETVYRYPCTVLTWRCWLHKKYWLDCGVLQVFVILFSYIISNIVTLLFIPGWYVFAVPQEQFMSWRSTQMQPKGIMSQLLLISTLLKDTMCHCILSWILVIF